MIIDSFRLLRGSEFVFILFNKFLTINLNYFNTSIELCYIFLCDFFFTFLNHSNDN